MELDYFRLGFAFLLPPGVFEFPYRIHSNGDIYSSFISVSRSFYGIYFIEAPEKQKAPCGAWVVKKRQYRRAVIVIQHAHRNVIPQSRCIQMRNARIAGISIALQLRKRHPLPIIRNRYKKKMKRPGAAAAPGAPRPLANLKARLALCALLVAEGAHRV